MLSMSETERAQPPEPGWYVDSRWPGEQRRWDGANWLNEWRPNPQDSVSPGNWMFSGVILGVVLGVVAGLVFSANEQIGWWALSFASAISGAVFTIGLIGKGVEVGIRAAAGDPRAANRPPRNARNRRPTRG
jgi:hypothetical protein